MNKLLTIDPPADACYVICRQYFLDPSRDEPATLHIDALDGPKPTVPDDDAIATRWRGPTGFVRAMTRPPVIGSAPSYASQRS